MLSTPPTTPRKQSIKDFAIAAPLTPRSQSAHEIKTRLTIAHTVTLSISHFTSLVAELTPTSLLPSLFSPHQTERTRLERIEEFRMDFLCGAFMREKPPELQEDAFSDGARTSLGGVSTIASSVGDVAADACAAALPRSLMARGDLAERTIKARLKRDGVLLNHSNFKSFPAVARRAMTKTLAHRKPIYCSCGLLRAPNFSKEYEEQGWAAPGIRWGNFKPDLVRFAAKGDEGEVTWEVVEIKYSASDKDIVYANYKIQAIYYHLALAKILSSVPNLVPSHKVSLWLSHDPLSPHYLEKPLSIRTTAAFAEHHLFVLLPQWLHIVTASNIPGETSSFVDAGGDWGLGGAAVITPQATGVPLSFAAIFIKY
ncbi:hypothetical protein RQP46_005332 [Phenoliferia psychrophenolica]